MRLVFHRLAIASIDPLTPDSARINFAVPEELREQYAYRAGQHITVRLNDPEADGVELRRSYSICRPPPAQGLPTRVSIAVKRQGPGGFGDYAVRKLAVGDELDVLTPGGSFQLDEHADRHIAIAAGSGITPIFAILAAALRKPGSSAALLYSNRTTNDVMFLEELADLKDEFGDRFEVLHVLSREDRGVPLLSGHIDQERLGQLLQALGENGAAGGRSAAEPAGTPSDDQATAYYLCGPETLVESCRRLLGERGAQNIRFELFGAAAAAAPADPAQAAQPTARLTVTLGGRTTQCIVRQEDPNLLSAVLRERAEAPFACTSGVCGTCRARLTAGSVMMARDYALEPAERSAGYILTCQSRPTSDVLAVDFDC
jgi:ring-1,2-phenylacetyl-CoA epoxidase subunit PaaE